MCINWGQSHVDYEHKPIFNSNILVFTVDIADHDQLTKVYQAKWVNITIVEKQTQAALKELMNETDIVATYVGSINCVMFGISFRANSPESKQLTIFI